MGEVGVVVMVYTVAAVMLVVTEEVGVVGEVAGQMAKGLEIDSILGYFGLRRFRGRRFGG